MTTRLLVLTVGPVQDFIAAARRTRDLWFGSHVLSEISKATAKSVAGHVGIDKLIFPAPGSGADLDPDSPLNVANIILTELGEADPAAVARAAKAAAHARWRSFADEVLQRHGADIDAHIWEDQVDDVVEFYAAWRNCALETYKSDREALMRLLGARKRFRDFQAAKGRAGVPKSSLDGLRESVLRRRPKESSGGARRGLRLQDGEQLDVVGMVKRAWAPDGGSRPYPSVARVAADPWLRSLSPPDVEVLVKECRDVGHDVVHKVDVSERRGHPHYSAFPFDGAILFRSRHPDICEEAGIEPAAMAPVVRVLERSTKKYGEPSPYLAILAADGDRMGRALSKLPSPDAHREFSQSLASFAAKARTIVDDANGVLVYSGGDDVLAFAPVDRCLACARSLCDAFADALRTWSDQTGTELTLSVGVAIAHFMEPLEDLLQYARAAEKHAKSPRPEDGGQVERNGLAVHVVKRGGGPLAVRSSWSNAPDAHFKQLAEWLSAQSIPVQAAYDMHRIARVYDEWPPNLVEEAIQRDVLSVMQGKQPRGASAMQEIAELVRRRVKNADSLRALAGDLLVAKAIRPGSARASAGAGTQ